jgi:hypothetical protein
VSRKPFINNQNAPLTLPPYSSRVSSQEFAGENTEVSKNYVLLGFRPGYALQASELNEMQEHFYLQQTLTTTMISNWGVGSGTNQTPGWGHGDIQPTLPGLTPISPSMVTVSSSDLVTFQRGWYLAELPKFGTQTDSYRFKVWIYSNEELSFTANQPDNSTAGYVGFGLQQEFVTEDEDGTLGDNSSGAQNVVPGATRYKVSIVGLIQANRDVLGPNTPLDGDDSPLCIKIQNSNFTYINGYSLNVI